MAEKTELTREQLIDYVKKQKVKIKKLEAEVGTLKAAPVPTSVPSSTGVSFDDYTALEERAKSLSQMVESHAAREVELTDEINKLQFQVTTSELQFAGSANEITNLKSQKENMVAEIEKLENEVLLIV